MEERSRVLLATILGAVAGGVCGWLYLTEQGARVRTQIEPKLDDFIRELGNVRDRHGFLGRSRALSGLRELVGASFRRSRVLPATGGECAKDRS